MILFLVLTYISVVLSLGLAYYYRNRQFRFFFILSGLNDLISTILWNLHLSNSSQNFWIPINFLLLFSAHEDFFLKWKKFILGGLILVIGLNFFSTTQIQHYFVLIINLYLLLVFLKFFASNVITSNKISLFYFLLVLYEIHVVINFLALIRNLQLGIHIYYIGLIAQIIIKSILLLMYKRVDKVS